MRGPGKVAGQGHRGTGMKRIVTVTLVVTLVVAGCGRIRDSRFNPFNWFGGSQSQSREVSALEAGMVAKVDPRPLVDQVTVMTVNRTPQGAIIQATGLPPTQGFWDAELVAENDGEPVDGVLTYRFVVSEPQGARRVSTPQSREVTAAAFVTNRKLDDISKIVVQGLRNSHVSSR